LPPIKHERWWDVAPYQTWKMMRCCPLSNMKDDELLPPIKHERWWDVAPYQTWKVMRCCPLSNMENDELLPPIKHERWWDVAPYQTWKMMRCCPIWNMEEAVCIHINGLLKTSAKEMWSKWEIICCLSLFRPFKPQVPGGGQHVRKSKRKLQTTVVDRIPDL